MGRSNATRPGHVTEPISRYLLASALVLVALVVIRPTAAATFQDWCKDAGSYNDRDETACEVRELKESAQRGLA